MQALIPGRFDVAPLGIARDGHHRPSPGGSREIYFRGSSVLARHRAFQRDELAGDGRTEDSRSHLFGLGEAEGSLGTHSLERNDGPTVMQRALTEPFLPRQQLECRPGKC